MDFFIQTAYAQGAQGQGDTTGFLIMMGLMFAAFYFLLIRPQSKRAKAHRELIENLSLGDSVVTAGGIHGKVAGLQEKVVTVEIATGVKVKINRSSIVSQQGQETE